MRMYRLLLIVYFAVCTATDGYAYDFYSDGIFYNFGDNNTVSVTSGSIHYTGEVVIPSKVIHYSVSYNVTCIGGAAFSGCSGLTSITIPNSVTSIGDGAFYHCSGLTSVTIPNSVTSIGSLAFRGCSALTSITIPNSVTNIGNQTFQDCSSLTSITIPNSVTSIGSLAFRGCSGLTSITVSSGNMGIPNMIRATIVMLLLRHPPIH